MCAKYFYLEVRQKLDYSKQKLSNVSQSSKTILLVGMHYNLWLARMKDHILCLLCLIFFDPLLYPLDSARKLDVCEIAIFGGARKLNAQKFDVRKCNESNN